jgi:hypothetical protein
MIRVFVVYEHEPEPARYLEHAALCEQVPGGVFRHGRVFGAPLGHEPPDKYYAEWEFPDLAAFQAAAQTEEFRATGKDALELGIPMKVMFADVA